MLDDWKPGPGPLYQSLARALRTAIQRGDVPHGSRLPSERELAKQLLVSRTTVVAAYELLHQENLVERRQGSGTRVRYPHQPTPAVQASVTTSRSLSRNTLFRRYTDGPDDTVDLVGAYLVWTDGLPGWALEGLERELTVLSRGPGYAPLGHPPLRSAIATHMSRYGLPTTPEQVLVTSGAQQAIHLAASLFLQAGDTVVVENPTYPGALDVFSTAGAHLTWVGTGRSGADVAAIEALTARASPRLVYVMATFHNPVGGVMPESRRRRLAQFIDERHLIAVDDQCLADLGFSRDAPPPALASYAPDATILTIGSTSKLGWGGVRIGWVRAPAPVVARLGRLKAVVDLGSSLPGQVIATRLMESFDVLQPRRRELMLERFELASELLGRLLPEWSWDRPQGGLCLWVRLPRGTATEFAIVAQRHGVSVVAGPVASPDGSFGEFIRLPFGHETTTLTEGIHRLARAWATYEPAFEPRRHTLEVIV